MSEGNNQDNPSGSESIKITVKWKAEEDEQQFYSGFNRMNHMLDARDQILVYSFNFTVQNVKPQQFQKQNLRSTEFYQKLKKHMKVFLVNAVTNITSVSFEFFRTKKLEQGQAKDYTAKNILLNSHNLLSRIICGVDETKNKKQVLNISLDFDNFLKNLKMTITVDADMIICDEMQNLAPKYPQAPIAGVNHRIKDMISLIDRVEKEDFDFIKANKMQIKYSEQKDYTRFIMDVINQIISAAHNCENDWKGRSILNKFQEFNTHLFWLVQQEQYGEIINNDNRHKKNTQEKKNKDFQQDIVYIFQSLLKNEKNEDDLNKKNDLEKRAQEFLFMKEEEKQVYKGEHYQQYIMRSLMKNMKSGIQNMKTSNHKHYEIGSKIPASVQEFNKQELANLNFHAKHSSVLRILTKWNQHMQSIFKDKEKNSTKRIQKFKNQSCKQHEDIKPYYIKNLLERLNREEPILKGQNKQNVKSCFHWLSFLITESQNKTENLKERNYSSVLTLASKMYSILEVLTLQKTNKLIHHLLFAGKVQNPIHQRGRPPVINLVSLGIFDLLRSKLECKNENIFINVLSTLYILNKKMNKNFNIIRIKDKLNEQDNNIFINYLFMGKIQCELQLSLHQSAEKNKMYHIFSHLIYEINRGKYGSLIQCAAMIKQHDPLLNNMQNSSGYYKQKIYKKHPFKIQEQRSSPIHEVQLTQRSIREKIFICEQCNSLITSEKTTNILHHFNICSECHLKRKDITLNQYSRPPNYNLIMNRRIVNYSQITRFPKEPTKIPVIMTLKVQSGQLFFVIQCPRQNSSFLVRISDDFISTCHTNYKYDTLDYMKIDGQIEEKSQFPTPTFQLEFINTDSQNRIQNWQSFMRMAKINTQLTSPIIKRIVDSFHEFRLQKNLIKTLRKQEQFMNLDTQELFDNFDKICRIIMLKQNKKGRQADLKYSRIKFDNLDFVHHLRLHRVNIKQSPLWLGKCERLTKLEFNSISTLKQLIIANSFCLLEEISFLDCLSLKRIQINSLDNLSKLAISDCNNLKQVKIQKQNQLSQLLIKNTQITKIDDFIFSKFEKLKKIQLINNPHIEKFSLNDFQSLKKVHIKSHSALINLTLENLPSLDEVETVQNICLHRVDLINLTNLKNFSPKSISNLTQISIKSLPKLDSLCFLENIDIQIISLNDIKISTLNFKQNINLTYLSIENLPQLKQLSLPSQSSLSFIALNNLPAYKTPLNLKGKKKLTKIILNDLPTKQILFENLEMMSNVFVEMQNLHSLITLDFSQHNCDFKTITLSNLSKLNKIDLSKASQIKKMRIENLQVLKQVDLRSLDIDKLETNVNMPASISLIFIKSQSNKELFKRKFGLSSLQALQYVDNQPLSKSSPPDSSNH